MHVLCIQLYNYVTNKVTCVYYYSYQKELSIQNGHTTLAVTLLYPELCMGGGPRDFPLVIREALQHNYNCLQNNDFIRILDIQVRFQISSR